MEGTDNLPNNPFSFVPTNPALHNFDPFLLSLVLRGVGRQCQYEFLRCMYPDKVHASECEPDTN